jgi:hypothetical protein
MKISGWILTTLFFSFGLSISFAQEDWGSDLRRLADMSESENRISKRRIVIQEPAISAKDRAKILPDREDFIKYSAFLKLKNTQLVKILLDPKCNNHLVVNIKDEQCTAAFPLKGNGSYYSFRTGSHFDSPFADIHYIDGNFEVGFKDELLGILVELGDVPIETLSLKSTDVWVLSDFKAANKSAMLEKQKAELKKGIVKLNQRVYTDKVSAKSDTTYLIRTIAYQYKEQAVNDKRIDAVLAFRVVKKDEGSVTILWHGLDWKYAPKLK